MSRILKRPMFRMGGTPNEGIMHGLVDRKGYDTGSKAEEYADEYYSMLSKYKPPAPRFPMGQIGLNLVSGQYAGDGFLSNVARSAKDPYAQFTAADDARRNLDYETRMTAAQMGISRGDAERLAREKHKYKMEQIAETGKWNLKSAEGRDNPTKALRNVYLKQAIENGYDAPEAQRIADYQVFTKTELQNKVGRTRVGGIIEFDLNDPKQMKKQLPKMKKDVGKYFYDPYDGKIKLLTEQNGVLGFVEFNSVAEIDSAALAKTEGPTISTTPYDDEQKAMEQEKSRGYLTDEDIFSKRYP